MMTIKTPPELVKALADWIDDQDVPDANWSEIVRAALAVVHARHENDESADELAFENPAEGFRRGWRDVITGNTIPASELLDALNDEE